MSVSYGLWSNDKRLFNINGTDEEWVFHVISSRMLKLQFHHSFM